jgi:uncharacterized protein
MNARTLSVFLLLTFLLPQAGGWAAQYDIKEMTPAVDKAFSGRQSRYNSLTDLKTQGIVGEDNRGYVHALKQIPGAAEIVAAENDDRRAIYTAIVDQNNLGPAGLKQVEVVFAEVQREKAREGDFIQLPSGDWQQK